MKYVQLLQGSLHLFRNTKLIWVLGIISALAPVALSFSDVIQGSFVYLCVYIPACLIIGFFSLVAAGSLIYVVSQTSTHQLVSFPIVWAQGRSKVARMIGFLLLILPGIFLMIGIYVIVALRFPESPFLLPIVLILGAFISSLFTFGLCTIMIDDLKAGQAAWTGFLLALNNFGYGFLVTAIAFFLRAFLLYALAAILSLGVFGVEIPLELKYSTLQKLLGVPIINIAGQLIDVFLIPWSTVVLTLGYREFTKRISYPALVKRRSAA
jgi:hypothetical protein